MIVMPANSTKWSVHCIARETSKLGHLYSPQAQTGPYPWLPYALDNGAFSCWDMRENIFDIEAWEKKVPIWLELLQWAQLQRQQPLWAIVPDYIGNAEKTIAIWEKYAPFVQECGFPLAMAVQDGMDKTDVRALKIKPDVIAIGGTDKFKWGTLHHWARCFPRVHVLRVNSPAKLYELEALGIESCDGTGWMRGDETQFKGLEGWAYQQVNLTPIRPSAAPNPYSRKDAKEQSKQKEFSFLNNPLGRGEV